MVEHSVSSSLSKQILMQYLHVERGLHESDEKKATTTKQCQNVAQLATPGSTEIPHAVDSDVG